jgi:hypothetical protein
MFVYGNPAAAAADRLKQLMFCKLVCDDAALRKQDEDA